LEVHPDTPSHSTVLCRRRSPCRDQTSRWGIGKRDGMVNNDAMVGGRPAAWAAAAATTHRATNQSPSPGRGIQCGDASGKAERAASGLRSDDLVPSCGLLRSSTTTLVVPPAAYPCPCGHAGATRRHYSSRSFRLLCLKSKQRAPRCYYC
jgi:hypothetical protein